MIVEGMHIPAAILEHSVAVKGNSFHPLLRLPLVSIEMGCNRQVCTLSAKLILPGFFMKDLLSHDNPSRQLMGYTIQILCREGTASSCLARQRWTVPEAVKVPFDCVRIVSFRNKIDIVLSRILATSP